MLAHLMHIETLCVWWKYIFWAIFDVLFTHDLWPVPYAIDRLQRYACSVDAHVMLIMYK